MADIVSSLFGLTPREAEQQATQQNYELGALIGAASINPYDTAINQDAEIKRQAALAALGGQAVRGVAGMFGVQDERLKRATTLESILQSTQQELGANVNNPAILYPALQQKLAEAGFSREAMQVGQVGQKAMQEATLGQAQVLSEKAQAAKYNAEATKALREGNPAQALFFKMAEKATPQSVAKAMQAGMDISLLDSPDVTKYSPLAQQLIDAGIPYGTPAFNTKMLELIDADKTGKAKGTGNVSVNVGGISIDAKRLGEKVADVIAPDVGGIQDTYAQLEDFAQAKDMLKKGIFAGPYGPTEMKIAKNTRQNLGKVANTEKFKSYVASNVIKRLKDIGGNDTQEERAYLESMVGGDITFEPEAILAVIESGEKKIRDKIARTSQQVESAGKGTPISVKPLLKDGQSGVSNSGKPMVVRNGKWEYK